MSVLSALSDEDALRVIALPYKAAMLVSHADDIDGGRDDEAEARAIERGIPSLRDLHKDSALVCEVADALPRHSAQWGQWENESFHVLKQAPQVIALVHQHFGLEEARHYRAFTIELGKMVARAHSEFASFDTWEEDKKESLFGSLIGKIVGGFAPGHEDEGDPANISATEKATLKELAQALKLD